MTAEDRARLLKLLRLLGSNHDGERAAAAMKAHELVTRLGGWEIALAAQAAPTQMQWPPQQPGFEQGAYNQYAQYQNMYNTQAHQHSPQAPRSKTLSEQLDEMMVRRRP